MATAKGCLEDAPVTLPHKPTAPLSYHFVRGHGTQISTHLIVFLNGLMMSQESWQAAAELLLEAGKEKPDFPSLLTYDRYGQGHSAQDPSDESQGGVHDLREVVRDLHVLIHEIWTGKKLDTGSSSPLLIFVANSIGCAIARLYAETYPGSVHAVVLLDSNMANSNLVDVFPDPDAPDFDPMKLPADITADELRETRNKFAKVFHPSVPNPEHLDRRNIAEILPHADRPALQGSNDRGPHITVVGHDWDVFAQQSLEGSLQTPIALTNAYMNPAWNKYNEGLVKLTNDERGKGPVIAKGCGHFIQNDDPAFVARVVLDILESIRLDT